MVELSVTGNEGYNMIDIHLDNLKHYLQESLGDSIKLKGVGEIGALGEQAMKDFGYGKSLKVTYEKNGQEQHVVFSVMRGDRYGHQFYWDRASTLMFEYETSARLKKHVKAKGLGYIDEEGRLVQLKRPKEFFIVNELAEGKPYFHDLERIRQGNIQGKDKEQVRSFACWLAQVHAEKHNDPDIYLRRIRQLIGNSECIWGIIDAYPYPYEHFSPTRFQQLEKYLVDWRWKLRKYTHRLAVTHGDFHPWNVLIHTDGDFTVLDRSRGEWGEPADDIASMSCNYFLYSLYQSNRLSGDFEELYKVFWEEYLEQTDDLEILEVIAPFYVFRSLVIANPEWYPNHPSEIRQSLFRFLENILSEESFDYQNINKYLD
jgi:thiamine kinase-like enzyme